VFVVNKADRPDADRYVNNLKMLSRKKEGGVESHIPVVSTIATQRHGIHELWEVIVQELQQADNISRRSWLLTQRAWHLIREYRMRDLDPASIREAIEQALHEKRFNLYRFVEHYQ
jgi:LAO/AO transport system kinase